MYVQLLYIEMYRDKEYFKFKKIIKSLELLLFMRVLRTRSCYTEYHKKAPTVCM